MMWHTHISWQCTDTVIKIASEYTPLTIIPKQQKKKYWFVAIQYSGNKQNNDQDNNYYIVNTKKSIEER